MRKAYPWRYRDGTLDRLASIPGPCSIRDALRALSRERRFAGAIPRPDFESFAARCARPNWFNHCTSGRMLRFLRGVLAGGLATAADLVALAVLVSLVGLAPRVANVPALLLGGVTQFLANRSFVFRSRDADVVRQAALFVLVEAIALVLNAVLYEQAMRSIPAAHGLYVVVRLVTGHLVFLLWSYPLWHRVFAPRAARAHG